MKIKLKNLVFDDELISIRKINPIVVSKYRQACRNGAEFPRILIEKSTNKIVSGNHRATAMIAEFGGDYTIDVIVKEYSDKKELLYDFAKENATHGAPLDSFSKRKLVLKTIAEGGTIETLSKILNTPVSRLESYGNDLIGVTVGSKVEQRPAKKGYRPDKPVTEAEYNKHTNYDKGMSVVQQARQLRRWLVSDVITRNSGNVMELELLENSLKEWLSKK